MSVEKIGTSASRRKPKHKMRVRSYKGELLPPSTRKTTIDFVKALQKYGIKYVVVGAVPVQFYGRERFSRDVDFVLDLNSESAQRLFTILKSSRYEIIYPLPHEHEINSPNDLLNWHLVKLKDVKTNSLVDVIVKPENVGISFDSAVMKRMRKVVLNGTRILIPSPEDYLITKLVSRRPSTYDYADIISTLSHQFNKLDWGYLERRARDTNTLTLLNYYREGVERKRRRGQTK